MDNTEIKENILNIGDTIKIGRTVYTVVASFEDTYEVPYKSEPITEKLYVGKYVPKNSFSPVYSNIIRCLDGKWELRS